MRVETDNESLLVEPGGIATLTIDIRNTGDVIDGVSARVIGLAEEYVRTTPELLPLFPDANGQIQVNLAVPATLHAGRHPLTIELVSHGAKLPSQYVDVDVDVIPRPGFTVTSQPRTIRARGSARFVIVVANEGNVGLDIDLATLDVDRSVQADLNPPSLRLAPGAVAPVLLSLHGPRMIAGGEVDRPVTVQAHATALPVIGGEGDEEYRPQLAEATTTLTLRQRPILGRGILTALILASIVGLWAAAFLLGISRVFANDPVTKQAPASFFLPEGAGDVTVTGVGTGNASATVAAPPPADALPKTGQMPPGTGGAISGKVTASTDGSPVGRILVQAKRSTPDGLVVVSSAATQTDGTYTLGGLFPTSYYLEYSAPGFKTVWYPNAPSASAGTEVATKSSGTKAGVNVAIVGHPASISGSVNPGDTTAVVVTTVTARALKSGAGIGKSYKTTTNSAGKYALKSLPAPGTYELTFTTSGYQASTLIDTVTGGDKRLEPTVTLGAAVGQISGVVTDGSQPLGGATVATTLNGQPLTVTTPTSGQVGAYVLGNLTTPGTYVVTYSAPGHGSVTKIIDLEAGQSVTGQDVPLASGSGTVTGKLVDASGKGLGGATVTVGGATGTGAAADGTSSATTASPTTTTLTTGSIGSFQISGLAVPGSYTLTFALDGYAPATVPITLSENGAPPTVTVTLSKQLGGISGTVTDHCSATPPTSATVTATDGKTKWTVNYSGKTADLPNGGYLIAGLQPGTYSVTAAEPSMQQQTSLVTVVAGQTVTQNLVLNASGC